MSYKNINIPNFSKNNFYGYFYKILCHIDLALCTCESIELGYEATYDIQELMNITGMSQRVAYEFVTECLDKGIMFKSRVNGCSIYTINKDYLIMRRDNV